MTTSPILTIDAVAARYHTSRDTIYRWLRSPRSDFPRPIPLPSRGIVWRVDQLDAWERAKADAANATAA